MPSSDVSSSSIVCFPCSSSMLMYGGDFFVWTLSFSVWLFVVVVFPDCVTEGVSGS